MAWGEGKSSNYRASVEGPYSEQVPASYLQESNSVFNIRQRVFLAKLPG